MNTDERPIDFKRKPHICFAGLSMWIWGYQYLDAVEYWDANWVRVLVRCVGQRASVELCDSCIHLPELVGWAEACVELHAGRVDQAELQTMEPYLKITIDRSGGANGLVASVKITPDNVTQFHEFRFPIDLSCLPPLVESLNRVLARFPVRGI